MRFPLKCTQTLCSFLVLPWLFQLWFATELPAPVLFFFMFVHVMMTGTLVCLPFPQCSWQRREGGQQNQIHTSAPDLLSAVSAPDLSPLSGLSHPDTSILLVHLHPPAVAVSAWCLPASVSAFPLPVPAAGVSRVPGFGPCGEHVSGLPSEPQNGPTDWSSLHYS